MNGLTGNVLEVDLSAGTWQKTTIDESIWRDFLGGAGVAAKLFFDKEDPDLDPLGPQNPLYLMAGPMAGTGVQGSSRFALCAKSPQTGIWGEATCGGNFAVELKKAGWDGIIFRGAAAAPTMLIIEDERIELRSADEVWGKDTFDTVDALKPILGEGPKKPKVLCIGQAGERLVKFAAACNDKADFAGRTGMGAVMGSKKLKAVVCKGTGKVQVNNPEGVKAIKRKIGAQIKDSVPAQSLKEMGTNSTMDLSMMIGDVPIRNYRVGEDLEVAAAIGGPTMTELFLVKPASCLHCPIACRRVMKNDEGPYAMEEGPGPEYETVGSFGALCHNTDAAAILKMNEWCNRYGIDTISGGATIAWAMDCYNEGILSAEDLDGIELTWGNAQGILDLVHKIGMREGVGDLLAEGSREAARRVGKGSEKLTAEIKGLELPMHDPRGSHGMGLAYMMSNRGACHNAHLMHPVEQGMVVWEDVGFEADYDGLIDEGKAVAVRLAEDYGVQCNAIPLCVFDHWTYKGDDPYTALNAVTGWDLSLKDYLATGARIWLIKRALINLMGITAADDRLPAKVLTPVPDGAAAGSVPDHDKLRREYYQVRGLDERGWPTRKALDEVGLGYVADRLEKQS